MHNYSVYSSRGRWCALREEVLNRHLDGDSPKRRRESPPLFYAWMNKHCVKILGARWAKNKLEVVVERAFGSPILIFFSEITFKINKGMVHTLLDTSFVSLVSVRNNQSTHNRIFYEDFNDDIRI